MKSEPQNLFDLLDVEDAKAIPTACPHRFEAPTVTIWPNETTERLTMTCVACGRVRGRYPREGE